MRGHADEQATQSRVRRPASRPTYRLRWAGAVVSGQVAAGTHPLTEASGPDSPINDIGSLSDAAKRVYSYPASVTLRFGSSHSKVTTIARVTHLSENHARAAIRELERRGLLSHQRRNTWHGRGAH